MIIEFDWKLEICDTDCYDEIFLTTYKEYEELQIFSRILPQKGEHKREFLVDLTIVEKNYECHSFEKKVDSFKEGIEWVSIKAATELPKVLNKQEYVLGFVEILDNEDNNAILLIRKNRPEEQKDKLNGIGGKVEPGESIWQAMTREFAEEFSPNYFHEELWHNFYNFTLGNGIVHCFKVFGRALRQEDIQHIIDSPPTDEKIEVVKYDDIINGRVKDLMPNVQMIVYAMKNYKSRELIEAHAIS